MACAVVAFACMIAVIVMVMYFGGFWKDPFTGGGSKAKAGQARRAGYRAGYRGGPGQPHHLFYGNAASGGNNPQWYFGNMGDAGWGGSMWSTNQPGQYRPWAASAGTDQDSPGMRATSGLPCNRPYTTEAMNEAKVLYEAQALDPGLDLSAIDDAAAEGGNSGGHRPPSGGWGSGWGGGHQGPGIMPIQGKAHGEMVYPP